MNFRKELIQPNILALAKYVGSGFVYIENRDKIKIEIT